MMLDWVLSIFVASIAAVLMVTTVTAVTDVDASSYTVGVSLAEIATSIANQVNKVEGFSGNVTESFTFNGTGTVSLPPNAGTIPFPSHTIGYHIALTRDVLLTSATIASGTVSRWAAFSEPAFLLNLSDLNRLTAIPFVTFGQLQAMDQACAYIPAGVPFSVELKEVWVDGQGEYLPLIYMPGYVYPWPSCP